MRVISRLRILLAALAVAMLWAAAPVTRRSASLPASLYRGYLAGRSSGSLLFSIVQAVGSGAVSCQEPSHRHHPGPQPAANPG